MKAKIFLLTLVFIATLACSKNNESTTSSTNSLNSSRINELTALLKSAFSADTSGNTSGQPTPEKSTVQMHLERADSLKLEELVLKIDKSFISEFDNKVSVWINFCKKQPGSQIASSYAGLACKGTNEYNEVLNFCKLHEKEGLLLLFQLINHSDCLSTRPLRSFLSDLIQSNPELQASSKEVAEEWHFADVAATPCNAQPILFIAKVLKNKF
jgi:hypothetical protein